jgi:carboxypeptidase Taq
MIKKFYDHLAELKHLGHIRALLGWDQQVYLPEKGASERAEQLEIISRLIHQRMTDSKFIGLVDSLAGDILSFGEEDQVNIRETKKQVDRERKLPESFVAEQTRVTAMCWSAWTKARPADDFKSVAPLLAQVFKLAQEETKLVGFEEHPYDALLDMYEPGAKLSQVKPLLMKLGDELSRIAPECAKKTAGIKEVVGDYDQAIQYKLAQRILKDIGYDFSAGRLDKTHHPFATTLGSHDIRVTTRYSREGYLSSVFTTLHEGGHALYEAGLQKKWSGTPMGRAVSLGIHESQSRLWENLIGRGRPFSKYFHKVLAEFFPEEAKCLTPDDIWNQCNKVEPSLIRVEADEVTYSLHVLIRLLLEEGIVSGSLGVSDLPGAWRDLYKKYLGIEPKTDRDGVLQDVHWYGGSLGYFSTYALGNIFGAMMMEKIREEIPTLDNQIEQGQFAPLLHWLNINIHEHGMRYYSPALIKHATGRDVSVVPFVSYLKNKFGLI